MTHAHLTKDCEQQLLGDIVNLESYIESHNINGELNEDGTSMLLHLTTLMKHEIERMEKRK